VLYNYDVIIILLLAYLIQPTGKQRVNVVTSPSVLPLMRRTLWCH